MYICSDIFFALRIDFMRNGWDGLGFRVGAFFSFASLSLLRATFLSLRGVWDGGGVNILHNIPNIGGIDEHRSNAFTGIWFHIFFWNLQ